MNIDNIIIGTPIVSLEDLDILPEENTITFSFDEIKNDDGDVFLPAVLVKAGLFNSTSEIRRINKDRVKSKKIKDPDSRNLWRNIDRPEFTQFKIGKKVFWLAVGDIH